MNPIVLMSDWLNATRPARILGRLLANRFRNRRNRPSTLPDVIPINPQRALGVGVPVGGLVRSAAERPPSLNPTQSALAREAAGYAVDKLAERVEGGSTPSPDQARDVLNRIIRRRGAGGVPGQTDR